MDPRAHARLDTLHNAIHNLDIRLTTHVRELHADVVNLTTRVTAGLTRADETRSWYIKFRGDTNEAIERLSRKLEETRDLYLTFRADLDETHDELNATKDRCDKRLDALEQLTDRHEAAIDELDQKVSNTEGSLSDLSHVVTEVNAVYRARPETKRYVIEGVPGNRVVRDTKEHHSVICVNMHTAQWLCDKLNSLEQEG